MRLVEKESNKESARAKAVLFENAATSSTCRGRVIHGLMRLLDQPQSEVSRDFEKFRVWTYSAVFLGELKATESIDLMITHLNLTDHMSSSLSHYPAVSGLIEMGSVAIPKLHRVLEHDADQYRKRIAIFCIAQIGGQTALDVLKQSQNLEWNRCNDEFLKATIKALENSGSRNEISAEDLPGWYAKYNCRE